MERAAAEQDLEAAEPLIIDTLMACRDADEWLAALSEHPEFMGLTPGAEVGDTELAIVCRGRENTQVCQDAIDAGRIEPAA